MSTEQIIAQDVAPVRTGDRVVFVKGTESFLLAGDRDATNPAYANESLPVLLHEGWVVRLAVPAPTGVYFILSGKEAPAPSEPGDTAGNGTAARREIPVEVY